MGISENLSSCMCTLIYLRTSWSPRFSNLSLISVSNHLGCLPHRCCQPLPSCAKCTLNCLLIIRALFWSRTWWKANRSTLNQSLRKIMNPVLKDCRGVWLSSDHTDNDAVHHSFPMRQQALLTRQIHCDFHYTCKQLELKR